MKLLDSIMPMHSDLAKLLAHGENIDPANRALIGGEPQRGSVIPAQGCASQPPSGATLGSDPVASSNPERVASSARGDWFLTSTAIQFYPLDPRPDDICIEDIAHALSHICRFGGHCLDFYSVAQHSVLVSRLVPRRLALLALMHDATEAYVGDMVRPLKVNLPAYKAIEDRVWEVICERFRLNHTNDDARQIKYADNVALMTERRDLLPPSDHSWSLEKTHPPVPEKICPQQPFIAAYDFKQRFLNLSASIQ